MPELRATTSEKSLGLERRSGQRNHLGADAVGLDSNFPVPAPARSLPTSRLRSIVHLRYRAAGRRWHRASAGTSSLRSCRPTTHPGTPTSSARTRSPRLIRAVTSGGRPFPLVIQTPTVTGAGVDAPIACSQMPVALRPSAIEKR